MRNRTERIRTGSSCPTNPKSRCTRAEDGWSVVPGGRVLAGGPVAFGSADAVAGPARRPGWSPKRMAAFQIDRIACDGRGACAQLLPEPALRIGEDAPGPCR
jgi:hypothetical protein